jgi:hypothetical protein
VRTFVLNLLLLLSGFIHAQTASMPPIINHLYHAKGTVNVINPRSYIHLLNLPEPFTNNAVRLVKSPDALLALVDASGMVYQLDSAKDGWQWRRIDSTYFSGYNMANLVFYANDRLYSFGGGGLWQITGHLRYYIPKAFEWELQPLNREIPHMSDVNDAYWLDEAAGQLYLVGKHYETPTLKDNTHLYDSIIGKCWRLDLASGNWTSLGSLRDTSFLMIANSPWGLFYIYNTTPWIVDFKHNRYLKGKPESITKMAPITRGKDKNLVFFQDSTLWFGDTKSYIDSITLSSNDFIDTGIPVYAVATQPGFWKQTKTRVSLMSFTLLALLTAGIVRLWKSRKGRSANGTSEPSMEAPAANLPVLPLKEVLTEKEFGLLQCLVNNSVENKLTNIDEINKLLGLQSKSVEVQKKHRSDALISLNQKLGGWLATRENIIEKERSTIDRRSYEYYILPKHLEAISNGLTP